MGTGQIKKPLFWIDANINTSYNQYLFDNYLSINFDAKIFSVLNDAIEELLKITHFTSVIVIISGKLYKDFYVKINKIKNKIKIYINVVVFLSFRRKDLFLQNLKILNLQKNNLAFPKYITGYPMDLEYYLENKLDKNEKELSFDKIENYEELILPTYISYFMKNTTFTEILYFNDYVKRKYSNNSNITNLIKQFDNDKYIPKEIIWKYWMHLYTLENNFYDDLNKELRNNKGEYYLPFIKLCYEMLREGYLKPVINKKLYRGAIISVNEYKNIIEFLNKKEDKEFPKLIVFSRCFLSFSESDIVADEFLKKAQKKNINRDNKIFNIFYIVDEISDNNLDLNCLSNTSISEYSKYPIEEEVLIFPFSCFEITKVKDKNNEYGDYKEIYLKYLGRYGEEIKEHLGDKFLNKISKSDFARELIDYGLIDYKSTFTWKIIEKNKIEINNICFYMENYEDFVGFSDNLIKIISLVKTKKKQIIKVHDDKIIDIIQLNNSRICSSSLDKKINIIKLINENKEYEIVQKIQLDDSYAKKIIYLSNLDFIFLKNNNIVDFYTPTNGKYIFNKSLKEERRIVTIKELPNQQIACLTNDNFIIFLDLMDNKKEINLKNKINENLDMISFENYLLIPGEYDIYIIDFMSPEKEILSFYLILKLEKIINISYDKFMIGLYNEDKNESLIRELKLCIKNNKINFDCIGEGFCDNEKIYNLIKINSSKVITKIDDNLFSTWIKIDEINQIYEPKYFVEENINEIENKKILINEENGIIKQKNEKKKIDCKEMGLNEINKSISNLNDILKIKYKDLNSALRNNQGIEVENIKQSIKNIDIQKSQLFKIKQEKQTVEFKKCLTFQKEANNIYNILPDAHNKEIKFNLEENEDEKLALKSKLEEYKKQVYN